MLNSATTTTLPHADCPEMADNCIAMIARQIAKLGAAMAKQKTLCTIQTAHSPSVYDQSFSVQFKALESVFPK